MSQLSDLLTTKVTINDEERKTSLILLCFALALYSCVMHTFVEADPAVSCV